MKTHYTIPFFIIHKGCPHRCIFCNQKSTTGVHNISPDMIREKIDRYLSTVKGELPEVEVGFFGGSFTGIPRQEQKELLEPVKRYLENGSIKGVRLSTRPDLINEDNLTFLKMNGVTCIELGVQSMSDKVLYASKRGHTAEDVVKAARMINDHGFILGYQMMLGLPSSTEEEEYFTAIRANELGAVQARIYPLVVVKNTELALYWRNKEYFPLKEEEALTRCANILLYFESKDIKVIRCGLHPSEELISEKMYLDGPFHPAFRQKVESRIFFIMLGHAIKKYAGSKNITINPADEAAFFGFKGENSERIKHILNGNKANLRRDHYLPRGSLKISDGREERLLDKKNIADEYLPDNLQR